MDQQTLRIVPTFTPDDQAWLRRGVGIEKQQPLASGGVGSLLAGVALAHPAPGQRPALQQGQRRRPAPNPRATSGISTRRFLREMTRVCFAGL